MTKEEIIENNKLIAKFLGWKYKGFALKSYWDYGWYINDTLVYRDYHGDASGINVSYRILIEVAKRISSMEGALAAQTMIAFKQNILNIEVAYEVIVTFIKAYYKNEHEDINYAR